MEFSPKTRILFVLRVVIGVISYLWLRSANIVTFFPHLHEFDGLEYANSINLIFILIFTSTSKFHLMKRSSGRTQKLFSLVYNFPLPRLNPSQLPHKFKVKQTPP
jgi:hypothetical protein